jgi:hypothetical protein
MEQNILLTKIRDQINMLQLQIESIASQPDFIYRIDIESLKRNVIALYDQLHLLKPVGTIYQDHIKEDIHSPEMKEYVRQEVPIVVASKEVEKHEITFVETIEPITFIKETEEEEFHPEQPESFSFQQEPENIEDDVFEDFQIRADFDNPAPVKEKNSDHFHQPVFGNTLNLFEETTPASLGESLAMTDDMSIAGRIQRKKIDDLRAAIGINEKFLFINELFGGNLNQYNNAINELNNFKSLSGVRTYLIELGVQYQWPPHSEALAKLNNLIERKF